MGRTLYVSDLDGTLLDPAACLRAFTREALNRLIQEERLLFTYATARSQVSASAILAGLELRTPVVIYNGAAVVDPHSGEARLRYFLEPRVLESLAALFRQAEVSLLAYAFLEGRERFSWIRGGESPGIRRHVDSRRGDVRQRPVDSWEALFAGEVFYLTIIGEEAETKALYRLVEDIGGCRVGLMRDTYHPEEWWLEIQQAGTSKAAAVAGLKQLLGADRVVCFGDNLNDLPLFQAADECYAVENAVEQVRRAATAVIASNREDGVARWLLEHGR